MTGKFIVIEGIDGAGKSTQLEQLKQHPLLQGAYFTFQPTSEGLGKIIREQIRKSTPEYSPEAMTALLVADRLHHITAPYVGLLARLNQGQHVVCDRYILSSLAYQSLTAPFDLVWNLNQPAWSLLTPDLTFFLDLSPKDSMERIMARDEELDSFETLENLRHIRGNYHKGISMMKDQAATISLIEAKASIPSVSQELNRLVAQFLG